MSHRQSTHHSETYPYISSCQSFVSFRPSDPHRAEEDDDDDEDQALFDVKQEEREILKLTKLIEPDYLRQKLEPEVTRSRIKTAISDSQQEIRILKRQLEKIENVASELAESSRSNQNSIQMLDEIEGLARKVIEDIKLVRLREHELEEIQEQIHRSNSNQSKIDIHSQLCKKLSDQFKNWNSLTLRQKLGQDKNYKAFRERIWEASGEAGIMPPLKSFLPLDGGEAEDSDESEAELEIGGTQNYKCPLCLGYLNVPLVSIQCKHTFCEGCFHAYRQQNGSDSVGCPNAGCSTQLTATSVKKDEALVARIRQFRRREQQRQEAGNFEDEPSQSQANPFDIDQDLKPNRMARVKSASQKKRRVVVDDDDD